MGKKIVFYEIRKEIKLDGGMTLSGLFGFVESEDVAKAICEHYKPSYNYVKIEHEMRDDK